MDKMMSPETWIWRDDWKEWEKAGCTITTIGGRNRQGKIIWYDGTGKRMPPAQGGYTAGEWLKFWTNQYLIHGITVEKFLEAVDYLQPGMPVDEEEWQIQESYIKLMYSQAGIQERHIKLMYSQAGRETGTERPSAALVLMVMSIILALASTAVGIVVSSAFLTIPMCLVVIGYVVGLEYMRRH